jgi:hypothetical protein
MRVLAWLGIFALGLQAYIPVHLANDIVQAVNDMRTMGSEGDRHATTVDPSAGDSDDCDHGLPGRLPHSHHQDCATFLTASSAGAFVQATVPEFRQPAIAPQQYLARFDDPGPRITHPASYASRAPPLNG